MYTIKCNYCKEKFDSIPELVEYATKHGIDPSHFIYKNGKTTHERIIDFITF